jgi:hypothetical protein
MVTSRGGKIAARQAVRSARPSDGAPLFLFAIELFRKKFRIDRL